MYIASPLWILNPRSQAFKLIVAFWRHMELCLDTLVTIGLWPIRRQAIMWIIDDFPSSVPCVEIIVKYE